MATRIFHVITTLGRGGAERQLVNLVKNTDRSEFEHVVCHLRPPDAFADELRAAGHDVVCLNLPSKWPWLTAPAKLPQALRAHRPDIIQTWLFDADLSVRLSRPGSTPVINTLHSIPYEPEVIRAARLSPLKLAGLRRLDALTARWTKPLFVACSETVKQSARRRLGVPESRIRVIYNSIDAATLRCAPDAPRRLRRDIGIAPDDFVYLSVGRLDPPKGHDYLLRAFRQVAASLPGAHLVLVGEGPSGASLRRLADELGVSGRAHFLGQRRDVGACLEMADAFVFPSLFEGLPLAPIEAMMKGLPCIATRIGPVMELIDDAETGVLVAPGSADELATAMVEIARAPAERRLLGARAKQSAMSRFDSRVGLRVWENLYREVRRPSPWREA
ncbi:MAG: glycosyltransferase [Pyrinomonadaceae bacterium]